MSNDLGESPMVALLLGFVLMSGILMTVFLKLINLHCIIFLIAPHSHEQNGKCNVIQWFIIQITTISLTVKAVSSIFYIDLIFFGV